MSPIKWDEVKDPFMFALLSPAITEIEELGSDRMMTIWETMREFCLSNEKLAAIID